MNRKPPQQPARKLLADTKLYCNVTSECKPCLAKHLVSEACRPTAYTEHLTCSTSEAITHETVITIHRRLSPRTTLLHVMQFGSSSSSSSSSDSSSEGDISLSGAAAAGHLYPLSAVGGLNLLCFELAMVVILSGALPIVYVRKRRYAR
ncbi:hypothetical protein OEZ86_009600 [Tetradesmus obliquus]|uniref:Uncharacterized protein n=1 Tax=Tetradesmus obliquus TaxID=3088 RepID=A0ABY8UQS0_TETOB|nr:hypothetical protein OEZ85_001044 [Tetradesmus obliquus]WIA43075.1 hypothetical protein OEZ86_009600 [Tetradesmus obliquus]